MLTARDVMSQLLKSEIVYFDKPGPQNTETTLKVAKERAQKLGLKDVVLASISGETGVKACEYFKGSNVLVVSHCTGWKEPGMQEMTDEKRMKIEKNGGRLLICSHAFAGIERAIRTKLNTVYPIEIISDTLRILGNGTKVAVEIVVMATDAGLIPINRDVIAIAGTSRGADTALVVQPANSVRFFDLVIKEIIAKPRITRLPSE